ncbi:MAG TPA: cupin domain-containing protein [Burkholderiales bacterium]|nr:cupin domain-containing protein [Burkholderiales bacterium]
MKTSIWLLASASVLLGGWSATIAEPMIDSNAMTVIQTDEIAWKDYPGLPGVKFVVLYGDPKKEGVYVVRAKFSPNTMSRPHWHPDARYVTVISGTWWGGTGDSFDPDLTVPIKAGGFAVHTAGEVHYDGAKDEEVVVQIIGVGPSGTTPVPIGGGSK